MKPLFKSKISLWASVLALVVVIGIGATLALMASPSNSVTNSFSVADIDTEIKETLTDGNKEVSIHNYGPSDGYVRARIMVSGVNGGDQLDPTNPENMVQWVTEEKSADDLAAAENKVYIVFNEKAFLDDQAMPTKGSWFFGDQMGATLSYVDSWFYYYDVLKAGTSTPNLIEKVQLSDDLAKDEDFLKNFSVTIYHESVVALNQNLTNNFESDFDIIEGSFVDYNPYAP